MKGSRGAPAARLIGVTGGSGAGKGWLVGQLCQVLGSAACHLELDDFYHDRSHLPLRQRGRVNFDLPRAIDWTRLEQVLQDCARGRPTTVPRYDFATYSRLEETRPWRPRPIVFVDGLWVLRRPATRRLFDLTIYVDTPPAVRCDRRRARDVAERGYDPATVEHRLRTAVLPMHERYVEPQRSRADVVLRQPFEPAAIADLSHRICALLPAATPRVAARRRARICAALLGRCDPVAAPK